MASIEDHPLRYRLANELHARPFPTMSAPCTAAYLAIKQPNDDKSSDRAADMADLVALLDRYAAPHPEPGATHYYGPIGRHWLKWEQHTEFVTYTIFTEGLGGRAFDASEFKPFPSDWLEASQGHRVTSCLIRIDERPSDEQVSAQIGQWFVPESLAVSSMLDDAGVAAGDFRIDENGHMRFVLFVSPETGARRIGRIVQRLAEIETYKAMSMLGFASVRDMGPKLNSLDTRLTALMSAMTEGSDAAEDTLQSLLEISAELETLLARSSFRFGATGAYEAIVKERIEALRERRWSGRQTFSEFMLRRYDPAMRTVKSSQARLNAMSARAARAADLLRTRVDVERSAQNQALLESMDRRSDLQLRLQKTVEGLSVVAISYYAVSLASYLVYPVSSLLGMSKNEMTALITVPVVLAVWLMVRAIRRSME